MESEGDEILKDWMFISLQNSYNEALIPESDGVWGWGLKELPRIGLGHEDGACVMELMSL